MFPVRSNLRRPADDEPFLAVGERLSWRRSSTLIGAVGLHDPRLHVVAQVGFEYLVPQPLAERRILDWEKDLHSAVEVPRHQAGAAQVAFRATPVVEVVHAAMLQ